MESALIPVRVRIAVNCRCPAGVAEHCLVWEKRTHLRSEVLCGRRVRVKEKHRVFPTITPARLERGWRELYLEPRVF